MASRKDINAKLSDDLLVHILRLVEDRSACCLVCKRWLKLEGSVRSTGHILRPVVIPKLPVRFPFLERVDLSKCVQVSDENLEEIARGYCGRLRHLDLSMCKAITEAGMQRLQGHCLELREINVTNCTGLSDEALAHVAGLTNLEVLNLASCRDITDAGLHHIAIGCRSLKNLSLRWCAAISGRGISDVALHCTNLESLDLSYVSQVTADGIADVAKLPRLDTLVLHKCDSLDDAAAACLCDIPTLQVLDISACQSVTDAGVAALTMGATSLLHLNIGNCPQISDEALRSLAKFPSLRLLKLDGCPLSEDGLASLGAGPGHGELVELSLFRSLGVTDGGLVSLISCCSKLNVLDLTCCRDITDAALHAIAAHCRDLRSLKMEGCKKITDRGLSLVTRACAQLDELDLTDCNITDAGLSSIASCTGLRSLKLGFCGEVTNAGIAAIGLGCTNLKDADLYRCEGVGDAGVTALTNCCTGLKNINLSYCANVSDAGLQAVARCRGLHNLELRGCDRVTSRGLAAVADGCRRLAELDVKRCIHVDDEGVLAVASRCLGLRQVNVSFCPITNRGLLALARLPCMSNMKLIHCRNVTIDCFKRALEECTGLRKVKLVASLRGYLQPEFTDHLEKVRGCKLRWMNKPFQGAGAGEGDNA